MRRFILKLLVCFGVFVALIYGVDWVIESGLKKTSYREISKWNEVVEGNINADILIMGSSRALVHFDPRIIEQKTGMSCYNLGVDGSKYEAQRKVLELYLAHNDKPKIIYWSLDLGSLKPVGGVYRYEQFLPFWNETEVKSILKLNENQDQYYFNIPIAKYSNNAYLKYLGLLKQIGIGVSEPILRQGYRESIKDWDGKFERFTDENRLGFSELVDESLFTDFQALSASLQDRDIEIRWIIAPYYQEALDLIVNSDEIFREYKIGAERVGVKFQNYASTPLSYQRQYFYNGTHLNKNGVVEFMKIIKF